MATPSVSGPEIPRSLRSLDLLLRIALFLGAVVAVLLLIVGVITLVSDSGEVTVEARSSALAERPASAERLDLTSGEYRVRRTELTVELTDPLDEAIVLLSTGALYGLGYLALWSVWLVVDNAKSGDPFTRANVSRLRRAGRIVVGFPIGFAVLELAMQERINRWGAPFDIDVEVGPADFWTVVMAGLALLAIAHVFERGVELRELEATTI